MISSICVSYAIIIFLSRQDLLTTFVSHFGTSNTTSDASDVTFCSGGICRKKF